MHTASGSLKLRTKSSHYTSTSSTGSSSASGMRNDVRQAAQGSLLFSNAWAWLLVLVVSFSLSGMLWRLWGRSREYPGMAVLGLSLGASLMGTAWLAWELVPRLFPPPPPLAVSNVRTELRDGGRVWRYTSDVTVRERCDERVTYRRLVVAGREPMVIDPVRTSGPTRDRPVFVGYQPGVYRGEWVDLPVTPGLRGIYQYVSIAAGCPSGFSGATTYEVPFDWSGVKEAAR